MVWISSEMDARDYLSIRLPLVPLLPTPLFSPHSLLSVTSRRRKIPSPTTYTTRTQFNLAQSSHQPPRPSPLIQHFPHYQSNILSSPQKSLNHLVKPLRKSNVARSPRIRLSQSLLLRRRNQIHRKPLFIQQCEQSTLLFMFLL